ncbi:MULTISPECIES: PAS domain S-box protein [unclassified Polaromonas]|uniref:sensor histidine kinase n=1 Tax=unclassified Polaromonas TaxID=2638319 RepID=UPI000F079B97|nr:MULTISPECIES: PAS domain S-box protein [unclassified Polaromonas]AYQ28216.1 PAS domain-containing sensor histidine kinase [Polaromonas sp. SP1]QGJ20661.1 PAS domain S-box protein [Polaromonas sp. Pch-P]
MPAQAHPTSPADPGAPGRGLRTGTAGDADGMEAEIERRVALRTRELAASLARYQTMVDLATENICVGQGGLLRFANPPCLALLGTQAATMADRPMIEFIHPDDREFVSGKHQLRAAGNVVPAFEARFQRGDGTVSWVEINGVLVDWEGAPADLFFLKDVTERKKLEALTRSAAERYRAVVENVNDVILVVQKGVVRFSNTSAQAMFGHTLTGLPSLHLIHPDDRPMVQRQRELMQAGTMVSAYEARFISPPGEAMADGLRTGWASIYGTRIEWDGEPALLVLMSDISERRRLDEELKSALTQREAILETTAVGVTFLKNRRHQWLNRTLANMLGYSPGELLGQETRVHYPNDEDFERIGAIAYAQIMQTGLFSAEARMRRKNGELIWVQLDGSALDRSRPEEGSVWTYVDITRRKEADEETRRTLVRERELGELKTRFVSMASHEFRTPLATILSSAELIEHYGEKITHRERQDIMADLVVAVKRMQGMLEDMLTVGQADAGKLRLNAKPLDIAALCRKLVTEVHTSDAGQHAIEFEAPVGHDAFSQMVMLDERLVRHIASNLLANACKYSPAGSVVVLTLERRQSPDGDRLILQVSDEGIGIPATDLPRLFESFHRGSNVGNRQGSGLGLAIVKHAVDLHHGKIDVASTPGAGTRFTVSLPLSRGTP